MKKQTAIMLFAVCLWSGCTTAGKLEEKIQQANQGDINAQLNLGYMYDRGEGVPQDYQQAIIWYRKAAEQGSTSAQIFLGAMYYEGKGISQDYAQASMWYRKAAEKGIATAQYNLGMMYKDGKGVPHDEEQAYIWLYLAATSGGKDAIKFRDLAADQLSPKQLTHAQQLAREWLAKHEMGK